MNLFHSSRKSSRTSKSGQNRRQNRRSTRQLAEQLESRQLLTAVNPAVIDLYMGYTGPALQAVGSVQLMNDKINRAVVFLNQALANSKVNATVRLVGTGITNYAETGSSKTDIAALTNLTDGKMDDLTNAGVAAGADVIDVVENNVDVGGITQGNYNIINLQFLDNGVVNHEFGHTLGGDHFHNYGGAG